MSLLTATVDAGSLSGAGRRLGVPLPTISRKISELEAELGASLLIRTTRKLALTDAGVAYVAACRRILEQVEEAERAAAGEYAAPKGELTLAAPILFGRTHVLPIVQDYLARFPEVRVKLALSDQNADLIDDRLDAAVRIGDLPDSGLVATRVGVIRRVVCASPAFFAAHGEPKTPAALKSLPGINFEYASRSGGWVFKGEEAEPRLRLAVNTAEAAIEAAIAGVGVARVMCYQVMDRVLAGELTIVLEPYEDAPRPVHLLHPHQDRLPKKTRAFLDLAAPALRRRLLQQL